VKKQKVHARKVDGEVKTKHNPRSKRATTTFHAFISCRLCLSDWTNQSQISDLERRKTLWGGQRGGGKKRTRGRLNKTLEFLQSSGPSILCPDRGTKHKNPGGTLLGTAPARQEAKVVP